MAQQLVGPLTIPSGVVPLGNNVQADRLAAVIERNPTTGDPYVAIFMSIQATGNAAVTLTTEGKSRIEVTYTDGTREELVMSDEPFNTTPPYAIPNAAPQWRLIRTDGKLYGGVTPDASHSFTAAEKNDISASKVANGLRYLWTDN